MPTTHDRQHVRRGELGAFLRAHRERLPPADAGLRNGPRRRTPGLRREEVATLAGVSVSWYTWLEQGRVDASRQVLTALATALRLDVHGRTHLLALAGFGPPAPESTDAPQTTDAADTADTSHTADATGTVNAAGATGETGTQGARTRLHPLLDAFADAPALLLDRHFDILAWNPAYPRSWPDPATVEPRRRNLMWMTVADRRVQDVVADWDAYARAVLAQFNALVRRQPGSARAAEVLELLRTDAPRLAHWWECRAVAPLSGRPVTLDTGSRVRQFTAHALTPEGSPDNLVLAYVPNQP